MGAPFLGGRCVIANRSGYGAVLTTVRRNDAASKTSVLSTAMDDSSTTSGCLGASARGLCIRVGVSGERDEGRSCGTSGLGGSLSNGESALSKLRCGCVLLLLRCGCGCEVERGDRYSCSELAH